MTLIHHRGSSRRLLRSALGRAGLFQTGLLFSLSVGLYSSTAQAESMDFALERLVTNADQCRTDDGSATGVDCLPDNDAFMSLINQFGMAIAPSSMYPARTTGFGGFEVSLEGTYTTVNGDAQYMKDGTRGPVDDVTGVASSSNDSPASLLQVYSVRLRKGFGFGVETGLAFGVMPNTSIISGGADLRLSVFEGFRDGVPGYFPDIAFTGSVRTITGSPQVQLTVAGVSGMISKPITIAETGVLTPWVGYQHLFIFGNSSIVDFTPGENALQVCDFQGANVPGVEGADTSAPDGSPVCAGGGSDFKEFNNNQVFDPVRLMRQRMLFGLNYRYEILTVGAQVMADVFDSARKINSSDEAEVFDKEDGNISNFAFSFQLGAQF